MWHTTENIYRMIEQMDQHLRTELLKRDGKVQEEKLWENTYIKRQIDKRQNGGSFSVSDHIRAMVYAMLSGGQTWEKYAKEADSQTGYITVVDSVFCDYQPDVLLECSSEQLMEDLKEKNLAPRFGSAPIEALLNVNISKLLKWEKEYGKVDGYYQMHMHIPSGIEQHPVVPARFLIEALADEKSNDKLERMGIPLVCEYLRNVGYDLPKPDSHIRRILGSECLGLSTSREASEYRAIELVCKLAKGAEKSVAETDYILWSYCAAGYGEVCTSSKPKCDICVAIGQCRKHREDVVNQMKNKYVLETHYKIRDSGSVSEIISKAAGRAENSFHRRIFQDGTVSMEDRLKLNDEVKLLLADRIPELLEATDQKMFDERHHKICEEIIHVYNQKCGQSYGIAQRWLNETLINLVVIDSALPINALPIKKERKYFHVSVGKEVLRAATLKHKELHHCALGLRCAPLKHENPATHEKMDWFHNTGETQPFEKWEYAEYMGFQNAVRNALKNPIKDGTYKDVLDWNMNAFVELS